MTRFAIGALAAVLLAAGPAQAQGPVCNAHLLNDDYGVQISGTRPASPGPLAVTEAVAGVAMGRFDGHGGYAQVGTTHGATSGIQRDVPATGTYVVNADCTGTITFQNAGQPFMIEVAIIVVGRGEEVKGVTVDPAGIVVSAIWRKK